MRLGKQAQSNMGGMCMQISERQSLEKPYGLVGTMGQEGVGRREGNLRIGEKAS